MAILELTRLTSVLDVATQQLAVLVEDILDLLTSDLLVEIANE